MKVSSESDNKAEMSPYWMKIEANELHGLGNPTKYMLSDTELMPDLVSLSGSKASNELVIFVLTSANLSCTTGSKKRKH